MQNEVSLFPYQEAGRAFLSERKHALLADGMGLGKSGQAIAACDVVGAQNILVLCPAAVRFNWDREFDRFSRQGLPSRVILSSKDRPITGVTICSYDLAIREDVHKNLSSQKYDILILDEAHFLKTRNSKRTQAVFGKRCDGKGGLAGSAARVWALTGTPAPNDPSELYPWMRFTGLWADGYWPFVDRYCTGYEGGFGYKITGGKNLPELKKKIEPITLRRRKEDVLKDLPPITYSDLVLDPLLCDTEAFKEMLAAEEGPEGQALKAVLEGEKVDTDLANMKIATLRRLTGLAKVNAVAHQVTYDLTVGGVDKLVIFGIHRDPLRNLRNKLRKFGAHLIFGGMDAQKKENKIHSFLSCHKHRVLLANMASAGTGVDGLQYGSCNVWLFESSWSPADNAQAIHRVHRIGQDRPVNARFVSLANTLDEHVQRVVRRKTETISQLFE